MLEERRRRKSPQQRKQEAYEQERRYCYEYRNGAVKAWAKKKARNQRVVRRKVKQLAAEAATGSGDEPADRFADKARALRSYRKLNKSGVLTLKEVLARKRATGRRPVY